MKLYCVVAYYQIQGMSARFAALAESPEEAIGKVKAHMGSDTEEERWGAILFRAGEIDGDVMEA